MKRFAESNQAEQRATAGREGDTVQYLTRHGSDVWVYSMRLADVRMDRMEREIRDAGRSCGSRQ